MPPPSLPGPDPSLPVPGATGVLRTSADDATFEADFADLAARFAAQSGGGLSPELSAELALEIVLNEVVEQACLATGATGAAIVLRRDGEMVCRASSGSTAPELGARLDSASGISGECIRTRQTQRCDDVLADLRVDLDASQRLGVRSVMVMPLLRGEELLGIFELFSSLPRAFGERDERTQQALVGRILNNLNLSNRALSDAPPAGSARVKEIASTAQESAAVSASRAFGQRDDELAPGFSALNSSAPISNTLISDASISEIPAGRGVDFTTTVLAAAVIVCVALLGLLLGRHVGAQGALRARQAAAPSTAASNANMATSSVAPEAAPRSPSAGGAVSASGKADRAEIPAGSLLVYENGREVFRQTPGRRDAGPTALAPEAAPVGPKPVAPKEGSPHPATSSPGRGQGSGAGEMQLAASLTRDQSQNKFQDEPTARVVTSVTDDSGVLNRVEPEYPDDARQQKIQGPVVLDLRITPAGRVQEMTLVTGQPLLVQAAKDAVQQWRFKPHSVNGRAAAMQTRVTLNFRLPQ
jgi:TonB family protein